MPKYVIERELSGRESFQQKTCGAIHESPKECGKKWDLGLNGFRTFG